jgi:hypothetical protein
MNAKPISAWLESLLKLLALATAISIFLKAIFDVDPMWDTWVYHLPFAGKLWGIVPETVYQLEAHEQARFEGFPVLAEFLQGFFWFVTRQVQTANLVGFLSVIVYSIFLKSFFQVPLYLSTLALFAIPLVQTHATSCYVDLPGNICVATLIAMIYRLFVQKNYPTRLELLVIFLAAAFAANIKPQMIPPTFVLLGIIGLRLVWLYVGLIRTQKARFASVPIALLTVALACLIIFATPIKNVVLYQNPFYPVRIEIAGHVLNHKMKLYSAVPAMTENLPKPLRWGMSVLEIRSAPWSVDQYSGDNPATNRLGGFFGAYVVFNLLLLGYTTLRERRRETAVAAVVAISMSALASLMPQSHELRYYMFWMVALVSLNVILVSYLARTPNPSKTLSPAVVGAVCTLALVVVIVGTKGFFIKPRFYSLQDHLNGVIIPEILNQFQPGDRICMVRYQPNIYLYSSTFHPELDFSYSVAASADGEECEGRKVFAWNP